MAKTKMVDGMLCRDKDLDDINFFAGPVHESGFWEHGYERDDRVWSPAEFAALYTITDEQGRVIEPPKPGEVFAVEIEL